MLNIRLRAVLTLLFLCVVSLAQEAPQPFASVDAAFKKSRLNWSRASEPFQQERARLGQNFVPELWKYLGEDLDKQDRISNFLLYPEYLHGSLPMPYLALQIQLKSLSLAQGKADLSSRIAYVTTSINAAILAGELELTDQAEIHKKEAESMMAKDKFLTTGFPAIDDYDRCIYDSIGNHEIKNPTQACINKKSASDPEPTTIELVEIPKGNVINKPEPRWTSAGKTSHQLGAVVVAVVIDENGTVESADMVSGPTDMQTAALTAARKARFQKAQYRGHTVKVRVPLTYQF